MKAIPPPNATWSKKLENVYRIIRITHLAASGVFGDKCHFNSAIGSRANLPCLSLEGITRRYGCSESRAEELEGSRVIVTDLADEATGSESKS